ncbi:hypothetical protein K432DRAFT_311906, partial [Lepidopterella palustris CBS 459.81]
NILVNFIIELPLSRSCTNIIVIVNYLFKLQYLIPYSNISALNVAKLFLTYKLHGLPNTIIFNRGT